MRILLFSGNHPRHLYVHSAPLANFDVCGVVCMQREELVPAPPAGILAHDAKNFVRHFADRRAAEQKYFEERTTKRLFAHVPTHYCTKDTLNSADVAAFVTAQKPDVVVIYGVGIIKDPVLSALPNDKINLHLGLSPWYRGAATLFWPFYNMQPHWAGATIHQIVPKADAGAIIHQSVPVLASGDKIHDVSSKVIVQSTQDLVALLTKRAQTGQFVETPQRSTGRLYKEGDFKPEHLRVIYDLFNNDMVDAYLRRELSQEQPTLIKGI